MHRRIHLLVIISAACAMFTLGPCPSDTIARGQAAPAQPTARDPEGPIKLTLTADRQEHGKFEPIEIKFEIKNTSESGIITFISSFPEFGYVFMHVWDGDVEVPDLRSLRKATAFLKGKSVTLRPGQSWRGKILVNGIKDMSCSGSYTIEGSTSVSIYANLEEDSKYIRISSKPISLRIKH